MRTFEVLLVLTVAALAATAAVPRWRGAVRGVAGVAVAAAVAQVLVEGGRWQLVPAWGAVGVAGVLALLSSRGEAAATPRSTAAVAGVGAVLSALLATALPIVDLDLRLDDQPVGTTTVVLRADDRTSPPASGDDGPRTFPVQAWWPAEGAEGEPEAYTDNPGDYADAAGGWLGLPPALLGHLGLFEGVAATGRAASPEAVDGAGLPVVLLSHGWGGTRKVQLPLVEAVSAAGYLVIAPDHVYGSLATEFPDGTVVPIEPALLPDGAPPAVYDAASTLLERTYRDDLLDVVDDLTSGGPLADALGDAGVVPDLDRLVLLGHSTGGGAAIWACQQLPACDGLLGYDPWVEPLPEEVRAAGLDVPLLSVRSEEWDGNDNDAVLLDLHAATAANGVTEQRLVVEGTSHRDVTALPLLTPLAGSVGLAGERDPLDTQRVTRDLTLSWLSHVFGGAVAEVAPLPDGVRDSGPAG